MHGGGGGTGPGGIKKARIEIIPLIDVIFFLLATFILFTLSLNKSEGLAVALPVATTAEERNPDNTVTITVTEDGTIAWNKDPITMNEFIERLPTYRAQNPQARVLINGDERAFFTQAIYVFDQVRKAGFPQVYIETRVRAQE
ncbi:MAG TPA: biopolymer transporter ExbD [Opitutaceae bacterium]|nr:biopolymer transporter ExbD [Opitutaceae bacterium]